MKRLWCMALVTLLAGCASTETFAPGPYRQDPLSASNPALLRCASGSAPVCDAYGGRTGKRLYNCTCKAGIGR